MYPNQPPPQYMNYNQPPTPPRVGKFKSLILKLRANPKVMILIILVPFLTLSLVAGITVSKIQDKQKANEQVSEQDQVDDTESGTEVVSEATQNPPSSPANNGTTSTQQPTTAALKPTTGSTPKAPSPTPTTPAVPPAQPPTPSTPASCTYPSQVLNLTNWKMTLPTGSSGSPTEILQPKLATFTVVPYFKTTSACSAVLFRAPTNGVTTSGSSYPRSELREMASNGTKQASWSSTSGTNIMEWNEAITAVPAGKRHVVAGQIHDSNDDVITIRLEYPKLYIDHGGTDGALLTSNYVLGTRFNVKWVVSGGKIMTYYNGVLKETYAKGGSGFYFKAGAYTQSNCSTESSKGAQCGADNYGEVALYSLLISH